MVLELAPQENSLVEPHQTILVFVAEAKVVRFHDTQDVTHLHMHGTHTYNIILEIRNIYRDIAATILLSLLETLSLIKDIVPKSQGN